MTSKKYKWQTAWSRLPSGDLQHETGLIVRITRGDGYTDLIADHNSLAEFQAAECGRGVPLHDIAARLKRLIREAQDIHNAI